MPTRSFAARVHGSAATGDQIATLLAKTKPYAGEGKYEFFKTSSHFDTTAKHADFMGDDSPLVLRLGPADRGISASGAGVNGQPRAGWAKASLESCP